MKFTQVKSLFIAGFALFAFSSANAEERVVATVDGYPIMKSQVKQALGKKANTEANRKAALETIIDDFVVQRAIKESGIKVDYAYVDQMMEDVAAQNGITYGQLLDALDYQGISLSQYRQQLAHQLLMEQVRQQSIGNSIQVDPKDVQSLAKDMLDKAKTNGTLETVSATEYRISHILIKTTPILNDMQAKAKLLSITADIKSGKITFEEAAKINSVDYISGIDGGDLGFNFLDAYDSTFANIASKSKIDVISSPFKSQFGWHILKVTDTRRGDRTEDAYLQKAYEQLIDKQVQVASKDWIKVLRSKLDIKYF
ncbi:peptidylprolyl isomerase [Glaesserella parasuis]|uniref:peptidylprolyl isomerase n=1 Tax=Glaesserella parasuis TaxID=738 RepID=UPI0004ED970B|nr:peptidylprolyl isomerase [Glaesserella parasuis]AIK91210.1 peptidylprolyl isomerase [Glaesserella parasuis]MDG6262727.1 peptidylprolyl isomerase [Glaesserella parasuis]MDG6279648.1 peptidylprolyl isomerase [Glaesserella parasuis]MDG6283137.1 peptidylprolyl isomerase [Glaesserella parasuis]MDG6284389.1 peptidylprolyl isomerase [Glaesserella parasuis]